MQIKQPEVPLQSQPLGLFGKAREVAIGPVNVMFPFCFIFNMIQTCC